MKGILEEKLDHPGLLIAPVVQRQCVLTGVLEGHGVLTLPDQTVFRSVACGIAPKQDCYSVLKFLEAWHRLDLLMDESPFRHPFQNRDVHPY